MLSLISKLQQKPEHVRKKIAMVTSAVVTGVVIIIWLVSLGSSLAESASKTASSGVVDDHLQKEVGPFQSLIEGLGRLYVDAIETLQAVTGAFSGPSKAADASPQESTQQETAAPVSQ